MKKTAQILGADLSKSTIDLFYDGSQSHIKIKNTAAGFKELLHWLTVHKINLRSIVLVMECTGLYSFHFENFLHTHHIRFAKVNALAIKRSLGLIRGKNDKIDARRIARYGVEKLGILSFQKPQDPALQLLQMLHRSRERLVKHRASLICSLKEYRIVLKDSDPIIRSQLNLIKEFDLQIKAMDQAIQKQINESGDSVKRNFELLTSIKGVGKVVATATLIKTKTLLLLTTEESSPVTADQHPLNTAQGNRFVKKPGLVILRTKA